MSMTDPIADLLTQIRNAGRAAKRRVELPSSQMRRRIAEILLESNYIRSVEYIEDELQGILRIRLRFTPEGKNVIKGIERISRPGRRVYLNKKDLLKGSRKPGMLVLTTSSGVMTDREAMAKGVAGEALFRIW